MPATDSIQATTTRPVPAITEPPSAALRGAPSEGAPREPFTPAEACLEAEAPMTAAERALFTTRPPEWERGMVGTPRAVTAGTDPQVMGIIVGVLVLLALNMRHIRRLFHALPQDLWSLRRRANVFDEHTANETRSNFLLIAQLCVFSAVMFLLWLAPRGNTAGFGLIGHGASLSSVIGWLTAATGSYYLFQLAAVGTVGYAFTDPLRRSQWRRGLNASSVLLAQLITIPMLVALFYPGATGAMLWVCAACYVATRAVFVAKGFRIFYRGPLSLVYFVLYIGALEILPPAALVKVAEAICRGKIVGFTVF